MSLLIRVVSSLLLAGLLVAAVPSPAVAQSAEAYFEFLMARRLESQGDYAGAQAALERAAAANPTSAEVRAEIAAFQLRRNRRAEAEKAAREALALDAANVEANRVLGLIFAATVDTLNARTQAAQLETAARDAITYLERAVSDAGTPTDITLHFTLGRLYLRTGNAAKAVEALTRVVNQNPGSVQGRLLLAQAFAAAGNLEEAIASLDLIVDDEPRVAASLAQYQEQAGLLKEAADSYTKALAVQPMSRELKFRRAAAWFNAKEYERAAAAAAEAQAQHPDDLRFPRLHARATFESGARDRAFTILEPTAMAFPRDASTQFALADLYVDAGRDGDAERTIRQLLSLDPNNPDALNYLGYLLADHGRDVDEAIRLVQRALDADPGNPSYLDSLGWAYFRRGDYEQAEKYLAPAAERLDRNSVIQDHFGDVLAARGRWQDAIAAWTRALEGDGGDVDRAVIEKKISDAQTKIPR
ncbi:MAG: tetratricopeptide repeat protein [Acidobacteria bacterium]|nr:tetratricopeptide repeat protein [Acidobacteriota bacterium]